MGYISADCTQNVKNVNLESIEHHCKYKDPDYHKSEILKLLSTKSPDNGLAV